MQTQANTVHSDAQTEEIASLIHSLPQGGNGEAAQAPKGPKPANKPEADLAKGMDKKAQEELAKLSKGWLMDGLACAVTFKNADNSRKNSVLKFAPKYAGNEAAAADFLKAFKEGYGGNASAIQTASKIKSVFEAWTVKEFEDVIGIDEKTKEPVKSTQSGEQWLRACDKGWEQFCELARRIRGKKTEGQGAGGGNTKAKTSINDEQAGKLVESTKLANVQQAKRIAAVAMDQIIKSNGGKDAAKEAIGIILQMIGILKDEGQKDFAYGKLAQDLLGTVNDFENERAKADAAMKTDSPEQK